MEKQINDLLFKMQTGENCISETSEALLNLFSIAGSYDRFNIVDVATSKTIFTAPANRFEVKFMDAHEEVGRILI